MRIGSLGGGQLSQMMALAGHPIGIEVSCYDTAADLSASHGGSITAGAWNDIDKVRAWASTCDVITYEWENVPAELVADLSTIKPVRPAVKALATAQDRWSEKRMLTALQIPVAPFRLCQNEDDLKTAIKELGPDVVVKTRTGGYDGKGQVVIRSGSSISPAVEMMNELGLVVEQMIPFDFEASIIAARSVSGGVATYPPTLNTHHLGILRTSVVDTGLSHHQANEASEFVRKIVEELDYVGVIALEMFSVGGRLLANEIAPRVHNSGHWTIEGAETSQFENHLRAVAGLPLGSTAARCPAAMINIIGKAPNVMEILSVAGASLHTYQKAPREGRKLGHVTVTAPDSATLAQRMQAVQRCLRL